MFCFSSSTLHQQCMVLSWSVLRTRKVTSSELPIGTGQIGVTSSRLLVQGISPKVWLGLGLVRIRFGQG